MNCSLPAISLHGISQARILQWVAIPFAKRSSQLRNQTQGSCISKQNVYHLFHLYICLSNCWSPHRKHDSIPVALLLLPVPNYPESWAESSRPEVIMHGEISNSVFLVLKSVFQQVNLKILSSLGFAKLELFFLLFKLLSPVWLSCKPRDCSLPGSFCPRQKYWSGLPFPPSEDHADPGIEPMPSAFTGVFFIT